MAAEEVSSSDLEEDEVEALYGPKPLPGSGKGTITGAQRKVILSGTGCSAAVRKREGWDCRKLTIVGPAASLNAAKMMAHAFILESQQQHDVPEFDTPGSENDRYTTKHTSQDPKSKAARRKRKRENRKRRERALEAADTASSSSGLQPLAPWMVHGYPAPMHAHGHPAFSMRPPMGYHCSVHAMERAPIYRHQATLSYNDTHIEEINFLN